MYTCDTQRVCARQIKLFVKNYHPGGAVDAANCKIFHPNGTAIVPLMSADISTISSFPIVDAHHHLWDLSDANHHYTHLRHETSGDHVAGDFNRLKSTYSIKDYLNDTQPYKVVKSVHVAASYDRDVDPWGDLKWLEKQSETNENHLPNGLVAYANLTDDQLEEKLVTLTTKFKNVRGIRQMLNWLDGKAKIYTMCDRPDYLIDHKWKKGFGLLNRYGLSFDLQIYQHQMNDAAQLAREYPNTTIILNHCGELSERKFHSEISINGRYAVRFNFDRSMEKGHVFTCSKAEHFM